MTAPRPGPDEILVRAADGRLRNGPGCANGSRAADVLVTFGSHWERNATWPGCWSRTYPMCTGCWKLTRAASQPARPDMTVQTVPAPDAASGRPGV